MKVYMVMDYPDNPDRFLGVFTTREKADDFSKIMNVEFAVIEIECDIEIPHDNGNVFWAVAVDSRGVARLCKRDRPSFKSYGDYSCACLFDNDEDLGKTYFVWASHEIEAKNIAMRYYQKELLTTFT